MVTTQPYLTRRPIPPVGVLIHSMKLPNDAPWHCPSNGMLEFSDDVPHTAPNCSKIKLSLAGACWARSSQPELNPAMSAVTCAED